MVNRGHDRPRLPACLTCLVRLLGQDVMAMTDLLNPPSATTAPARPSGRVSGRLSGIRRRLSGGGSEPAGEPERRPLTVSAAVAAVGAAGTMMAACMVVAVIGWFLADAGAHGETTDALR